MIKAVVFDLDGTITRFNIDVFKLKADLGMAGVDQGILEFIDGLPEGERARAHKILKGYEMEAAASSELNPGVRRLFDYIKETGLGTAIVTRNNRAALDMIMVKHDLEVGITFSRDEERPKPEVHQLERSLAHLGVEKHGALMVGDHRMDLEMGQACGLKTVLVRGQFTENILDRADFAIERMDDLIHVIEGLRQGL